MRKSSFRRQHRSNPTAGGLVILAALAATSGVLALPGDVQAMTAVKSGATGSAYTNALLSIDAYKKDPTNALKQQQYCIDPMGITDFQLTVSYDPNAQHFVAEGGGALTGNLGVIALNGYVLGDRNNSGAPGFNVDAANGRVTVRGYWPGDPRTVPQFNLNTFAVILENDPSVGTDVPTTVTVSARAELGDFMVGLEPTLPTPTVQTFAPTQIIPASYTSSLVSPMVMSLNPTSTPTSPDLVVTGQYDVSRDDYAYLGRGTQVIHFNAPDPGTVLIALDLADDVGGADVRKVIDTLGLLPVDPVFGSGYNAMFVSTNGNGADFNLDFDFNGTSTRLLRYAVIPEPTGLALLSLALPAMTRRRR
jgi:hypothetical protein